MRRATVALVVAASAATGSKDSDICREPSTTTGADYGDGPCCKQDAAEYVRLCGVPDHQLPWTEPSP